MLKFNVCNVCHDLTMLSVNINGIATVITKGVDYRCINDDISKSEAMKLLKRSLLDDCEYR